MGFLDKLVLPQSLEHIHLLHYMTILVMFLFIPFFSVVLSGVLISLRYHKKGIREGSNFHLRFAKEIIEIVTINKSTLIVLGVVPLVALILIYSQFLHNADVSSVNLFLFALEFAFFGLLLVFFYRFSFSVKNIFNALSPLTEERKKDLDSSVLNDFDYYKSRMNKVSYKFGLWGAFLLYVASYFYIAAVSFATYPEYWGSSWNLYKIFSSYFVFFKWIQFFTLSFAITGGLILFVYFFWEGGLKSEDKDEVTANEYLQFVKKSALNLTLSFLLMQPLLIGLNLILLPQVSLSSTVFGFSLFGLFLIFICYHFLYDMIKNSHVKFSGWIFILVVISSFMFIVSDQLAFGNSTKQHSAILAFEYETELAKIKKESLKSGGVSAEEIFKTKCSACHRFDTKLVGPPYKETLPKYQGKLGELVKFINNPTKINPDYPPMPAQGLKPAEAKAIATYILEEVKKY
jgi:cytochrome c